MLGGSLMDSELNNHEIPNEVNDTPTIDPKIQEELKEKYKHLADDDDIILLARQKSNTFELEEYCLTEDDENQIDRFFKIRDERMSISVFHDLFRQEYDVLTRFEKEMSKRNYGHPNDQVNRNIINFVSNTKLFIDYLEGFVKKMYPNRYAKWKEQQRTYYERTIEYPILYHLRNHVQHAGLPIHSIHMELVTNGDEESTIVTFNMSKSSLLKNSGLNSHARNCLLKIDEEEISFMPLAKEYAKMVENLYILALHFFVDMHIAEIKQIELYFKSRDLVEHLYRARIKKKHYIEGALNRLSLQPLCGQADVLDLVLDLCKLHVLTLKPV